MATTYAPKMMSPKQAAYIGSLLEMRQVPQELANQFHPGLTSYQASKLIDELRNCPWKPKNGGKAAKKTEIVPEGFYCLVGENGLLDPTYYKVQTSKTSGRRYALAWSGKKWVYASGAIFKLTLADKMTEEQAKKFGKKFGYCVCCGRLLTKKESVEAGIGPICAEKYGF